MTLESTKHKLTEGKRELHKSTIIVGDLNRVTPIAGRKSRWKSSWRYRRSKFDIIDICRTL